MDLLDQRLYAKMNIFFLDKDPKQAAMWLKDAHVLKMGIESAQLLSTAWHILNPGDLRWYEGVPFLEDKPIYKKTHENHPMAIWVRQSVGNYSWCWRHGKAIMAEYQHRWGDRSKIIHATTWILNTLQELPDNLPDGDFTEPPQCMPEQYHDADFVTAYRRYYTHEKIKPNISGIDKYTDREKPEWNI
jgi:hypothetical protein